jgi:peptidoglycan biosynthesis protein MviN/MurJ (putative lipid II flippase)
VSSRASSSLVVRTRVRHIKQSPNVQALVGTVVGSASGFLLAFAVAGHFGVGRTTDSYAFASGIALFVVSVVGGVLEPNVLAVAHAQRAAGLQSLVAFTRRTALRGMAVASAAYGVIAAAAAIALVSRSGWPYEQRIAVVVLLAEFLLLVAAVVWSSVHAGVLYSLGDFLSPTLTLALRALPALLFVPFAGEGYRGTEEIVGLIVLGECARALILVLRLRAAQVEPLAAPAGDVSIWRATTFHAINLGLLSTNPLVDRAVAVTLGAGAVTVLDLGEKIFYVPMTIVASAWILVVGAHWSSLAFNNQASVGEYGGVLRRTLVVSTLIAGATACVVLVGKEVVGDALLGSASRRVAVVAVCLLCGLPFEAVATVSVRLLIMTRRTRLLPAFALAAVVANALGDLVGARLYGVVGIAAATGVVRVLNAAMFASYCRRLLHKTPTTSISGIREIAARVPGDAR